MQPMSALTFPRCKRSRCRIVRSMRTTGSGGRELRAVNFELRSSPEVTWTAGRLEKNSWQKTLRLKSGLGVDCLG